jgi:hypothetical protein
MNSIMQQQVFLPSSPWRVLMLAERAYQGEGVQFSRASNFPTFHNTHHLPDITRFVIWEKQTCNSQFQVSEEGGIFGLKERKPYNG